MTLYSLQRTPPNVKIRIIRRGHPGRFDVVRREGRAWLILSHSKTRKEAYKHLEKLLSDYFGWDGLL